MTKKVTLIKGDGIGPEVIDAAIKVAEKAGCDITWEIKEAGLISLEKYNTPLTNDVIESIRENKVALKGPVTTPVGKGFKSVNVSLRKELDLYANLRPVKSMKGLKTRYDNIDMVIVRENTEGLYSGIEEKISDDEAHATRIITKDASMKVARFAFEYAKKNNRKKITALHKANILKLTDSLFLESVREVAKAYPEITLNDLIIDAACMKLVTNPESFDMILSTNLFGDIVSDLCAGLVGGLGLTYGANIGKDAAVFEPVHGSAPDIAGKNIANPTASILALSAMLKYIGFNKEALKIESAVDEIMENGKFLTQDLSGKLSTTEFTDELLKII